jgi:hypothetical protein
MPSQTPANTKCCNTAGLNRSIDYTKIVSKPYSEMLEYPLLALDDRWDPYTAGRIAAQHFVANDIKPVSAFWISKIRRWFKDGGDRSLFDTGYLIQLRELEYIIFPYSKLTRNLRYENIFDRSNITHEEAYKHGLTLVAYLDTTDGKVFKDDLVSFCRDFYDQELGLQQSFESGFQRALLIKQETK